MIEKTLSEIAQEAIQWLREKGWMQGKLSGNEQWMQCPFADCGGSEKVDNFSININSAKWHCQRCKASGVGLEGPKGLKSKLGYGYEKIKRDTSKQQVVAEKKEVSRPHLLSKEQADELLIPVSEYQDESGLFIINKFIEERGYNKTSFLSAFDVRVGDVGTEFPANTLKTGDTFKLKCMHLFWCQIDNYGNITHMLRRGLSADPKIAGKTMNSCGAKRIYLSKVPEDPITDKVFIVEGITDAIAIAHFCQSAALLGSNITREYAESGQLEIFKGKDVIYGVDADVPAETVQKDMEILSGIAKSVIRLKPEQAAGGDGKRDWNDMLVDDAKHLRQYILNGITTAKPFEAGKKESIVVAEPAVELKGEVSEFPESAWRGLFGWYKDAQKATTEAPEQYHFAVLKTVAGVILGRSVWVWCGGQLFPAFYTVLEGPSTQARKTTAANRGAELLSKVDPLVLQLHGLATAEGLLEQLRELTQDELDDEKIAQEDKQRTLSTTPFEGCRCLVILNEFATLLKKAAQDSSASIIPQLTQLYDCRPFVQNPTKVNPIKVRMPVLGIIGLTTKTWLEGNLKIDDVFGGFGNRFVFYRWTPTFPIPRPPEPQMTIINEIVKTLHSVRERRKLKQTEFIFDDEASKILDEWYTERWYRKYPSELDAVVVKRIDENVRKLALLYAALENEADDNKIHSGQLQAAIDVGNWWEESALSLFGTFGMSKQAQLERKILDILSEGSISRRELQRRLTISLQELSIVLNPLVNNRYVKVVSAGRSQMLQLSER